MALLLILAFSLVQAESEVLFVPSNSSSALDAYIAEERAWCPPLSDILPCTCDGPERFVLFHCDRITEVYSIIRAAHSVSSIRHFGKFSLTNSRIASMEGDILGPMCFEYIYMRKNTLTKIDAQFLESSRESLKRIEIIHNDVEKFPFREIASFPHVEYICLKYNSIASIPDSAFGMELNYKIRKMDFSFNKINHIGSNAFKFLMLLENLDLRYNKLTVINNLAFAALHENNKLLLNLGNNQIVFIADGAFDNQVFKCLNLSDNKLTKLREPAFRGLLKRMADRRTGVLSVGNNRFRCTCDKVQWIVQQPILNKLLILDFECADKANRHIQDLTERDIGCLT